MEVSALCHGGDIQLLWDKKAMVRRSYFRRVCGNFFPAVCEFLCLTTGVGDAESRYGLEIVVPA
jgi:hypothetical protein